MRLPFPSGPLAAAVIGIALTLPAAAQAADAVLSKVVLVMRHGIRPPTGNAEELATFTSQPWPAWPVKPGELTPHGAENVTLLGRYLRGYYARHGLLPSKGCPREDVFIWADSANQRTQASGEAMADGLLPGCGVKPGHLTANKVDPLFRPTGDACKVDGAAAVKAITSEIDLNALGPAYDTARKNLQDILAPKADCTASTTGVCALMGHNELSARGRGVRLEGPLNVGATMAENLFLEYAEGFSGEQLGWGHVNAARIAAVIPIHNIYSDVLRRSPAVADVNGGALAREIVDLLDGTASSERTELHDAAAAKVAVFVGHDTNLSNLAGVFDLHWTLPKQPDATAPDTALVFELWRKPNGDSYVDVKVVYQTLEDLRHRTALTPAHPAGSVNVAVPACAGHCSVGALKTVVERAASPDCQP